MARVFGVDGGGMGRASVQGSECTPLGRHVVRARIGAGLPGVPSWRGAGPPARSLAAELAAREPERDWILSRILWLSGTEIGHNRLGDVDTMRRYIYIHGAPDGAEMGVPGVPRLRENAGSGCH